MNKCTQCNQEIPVGARFCGYCGASIKVISNSSNEDFNPEYEIEESQPPQAEGAVKTDSKESHVAASSEQLSKETLKVDDIFQDAPIQPEPIKTDAKFDFKPLLQIIGLLIVVAVLLALIWRQ